MKKTKPLPRPRSRTRRQTREAKRTWPPPGHPRLLPDLDTLLEIDAEQQASGAAAPGARWADRIPVAARGEGNGHQQDDGLHGHVDE